MRAKIAAGDRIYIDAVFQLSRALEECDLRALALDTDLYAQWREQCIGPRSGHDAYRIALVKAPGTVHNSHGATASMRDLCDECIRRELRAVTFRRSRERLRRRDGIGVTAVRLERGERDIIDERVMLDLPQLGRGHNFGIDAYALEHRDVCSQPRRVALINHDRETSLDETASPTDDVVPVAEVAMALPGQLGFRREGVMHPDQRARPCRHPGANSAPVERVTQHQSRAMPERNQHPPRPANHDYVRVRCC